MAKLFKKLPEAEKRTIRYEILLSQSEAEEIRTFARIRNLSVAEYMRRSSLHRRTDVRYETEMVLALREVVQAIRRLHSTFAAKDIPAPKQELGAVIDEALAAMLRICK
jgi:hypothetical protein